MDEKKRKEKLIKSMEEEWNNFFYANGIDVSEDLVHEIVLKSLENSEDDENEELDDEEEKEKRDIL